MFESIYYRLFVFVVVMPLNGAILTQSLILGLLLIAGQIPFAISWAEK